MFWNAQGSNENLPPTVIRQLAKELKSLDESPPEGIKVVVNDEDFSQICADIEGPGALSYIPFNSTVNDYNVECILKVKCCLQLGLLMRMGFSV